MGLLGGICGIVGGFLALTLGGLGAAFGAKEGNEIGSLGVAAILFSIWGIVGAVIVRRHGKLGGLFMTAAAVGGLIARWPPTCSRAPAGDRGHHGARQEEPGRIPYEAGPLDAGHARHLRRDLRTRHGIEAHRRHREG